MYGKTRSSAAAVNANLVSFYQSLLELPDDTRFEEPFYRSPLKRWRVTRHLERQVRNRQQNT